MYREEETNIFNHFCNHFKTKCDTFTKILEVFEETLKSTKYKTDEYDKYVIMLLGCLNLKCFVSVFDRLSKGYWSDSEALIKKACETFLAQVFFYNNLEGAKDYCFNNIKLNKLIGNRHQLAKKLDELNSEQKLFPTDMEDFFKTFLYGTVYRESNRFAHMDFDVVNCEISGSRNNNGGLSSDLIIGPKFDNERMETTLNRLIFLSMFSVSFIENISGIHMSKKHQEVFKEFLNLCTNLNEKFL